MTISRKLQAFQARFPNEEACLRYLIHCRWSDHPTCPRCNKERGSLLLERRVWACSASKCGGHLSLLKGTAFAGTKKPLLAWFRAAWLFHRSDGSMTVAELQAFTGLKSPKTARVWLDRLRHAATTLFENEVDHKNEEALRLRGTLSWPTRFASCLPMIKEVTSSLLQTGNALSGRKLRWSRILAAWAGAPSQTRTRPRYFQSRIYELAFRLVVLPRCTIHGLLRSLINNASRPELQAAMSSGGVA